MGKMIGTDFEKGIAQMKSAAEVHYPGPHQAASALIMGDMYLLR